MSKRERVWLASEDFGCSTDPFSIGENVTWRVVDSDDGELSELLGVAEASTLTVHDTHDRLEPGDNARYVGGVVCAIGAVFCEFERAHDVHRAAEPAHRPWRFRGVVHTIEAEVASVFVEGSVVVEARTCADADEEELGPGPRAREWAGRATSWTLLGYLVDLDVA